MSWNLYLLQTIYSDTGRSEKEILYHESTLQKNSEENAPQSCGNKTHVDAVQQISAGPLQLSQVYRPLQKLNEERVEVLFYNSFTFLSVTLHILSNSLHFKFTCVDFE